MKHQILIVFVLLTVAAAGQSTESWLKGSITFRSSQHVYVGFTNTKGIQVGDTLFVEDKGLRKPIFVVQNLSSQSCLCLPINQTTVGDAALIYARIQSTVTTSTPETAKHLETTESVTTKAIEQSLQVSEKQRTPRFDGKLALTSYTQFSSFGNSERLRYNLSLQAQHIDSSAFSAETNLSFSHRNTVWKGLADALKVYSLAVTYEANEHLNLTLGRKINPDMANIGAVDGIQVEYKLKTLSYGMLVGARPDYFTYSFNPDLLQVGAFVGHTVQTPTSNYQTTLAVFNQMNAFKTDRRFAYIQHSNNLLKHVTAFASAEIDFYTLKNGLPATTFQWTSTYLSLRYRPWKKLALNLSYDARKNTYYYETFKNQLDSLIDRETRQGLRLGFNYQPFDTWIWGGNAGYRFKQSDASPSINATTFLTVTAIPIIDASATVDATLLRTSYLNGTVYGLRINRDVFNDKVYTELSYRLVNYSYTHSQRTLLQHIPEASFSWRMAKKWMISFNAEGSFDADDTSARLYINLTKRF
jgi:hypothetical protein